MSVCPLRSQQVDLGALPAVHFVSAGASGVPFSRNGSQASWNDDRADCFRASLQCIGQQANRADTLLEAFLLEQVLGFGDTKQSREQSPLAETVEFLQDMLGDGWVIFHWKLGTSQHGLPHAKWRIYVCGRKVSCFSTAMPAANPQLIMFPLVSLEDILDMALPATTALTERMSENLMQFKKKHESAPGSIVVCDLSRAVGKIRQALSRADGLSPAITCHNKYLFVLKVGDESVLNRFLTNRERAMLQGWAPSNCERFPSEVAGMHILGNAMSLPCVGMACACLLCGRLQPTDAEAV